MGYLGGNTFIVILAKAGIYFPLYEADGFLLPQEWSGGAHRN